MGYNEGEFLSAYCRNKRLQTEEVLEASPVATSIIKFMESKPGEWRGTTTELLEALERVATEQLKINIKSRPWPKRPNILSRRINEVKTNLREVGIIVERFTLNQKTGLTGMRISKQSSESSVSSEKQVDAHIPSETSGYNSKSAYVISSEQHIVSSAKDLDFYTQSDDSYDSYDSSHKTLSQETGAEYSNLGKDATESHTQDSHNSPELISLPLQLSSKEQRALLQMLAEIKSADEEIIDVYETIQRAYKKYDNIRFLLGDNPTQKENKIVKKLCVTIIRHPNIQPVKYRPKLLVKWIPKPITGDQQ